MSNHAYIGCRQDDSTGQYRALCKCSWKSPPFVQRKTAESKLLDHLTTRRVADAKALSRTRAANLKKRRKART